MRAAAVAAPGPVRALAAVAFALTALVHFPVTARAADGASDFPNHRIHIILPYPAGGIVDIVTRIVTDKMQKAWGQSIIIEPKPAANGNPAWDQVARAEPDGYTWTFLSPATMANPRMQNLHWSEKSFVPVAAAVWAPSALVVHPSLPVSTVKELVDYAHARPGQMNYAHPGIGTSQYLNTMIFVNATKINAAGVPYRGQPAGIMDVIANRVHFKLASIGLVAEHIEAKSLKALAVLGTTRSPLMPDVPTFTEAGFPEVNVVAWYGYGVPAATPRAVVEKINAGFNAALADPEVRAALAKQALQPVEAMSVPQLEALYASDTEKYAKVIRDANIRLGE